MAAKRKCIGCGAYYDFSFGEIYTCPYCGTEQNPGLSKDALRYMENADNYRRNNDFKKSINEYKEALKINVNLAEAHFGLFLASYKISSESDVERNYEINNKKAVYNNEDYKFAIENGGINSKQWQELGNRVEKQRNIILNLTTAINNNKYLAMLIVDENSNEDKELADFLFSQLQDRFNLLYPPYSFTNIPDGYKMLAINIALSEIPLLFIIQSSYTENVKNIKSLSEEFLSNWDGCYLYFISDDFDSIPSDIERANIELDYEATDLSEKILDEIVVMANLTFSEKLKFKKERKIERDSNYNPILFLEEN